MKHFGNKLRELRESRTLTQAQLAHAAGISISTLQKAEASATRTLRRSTLLDVMKALNGDGHDALTESDSLDLLQASSSDTNPIDVKAWLDRFNRQLAAQRPRAAVSNQHDAPRLAAHAWLDSLLDHAGADKVMSTFVGVAAAWGIRLPSNISVDQASQKRMMVVHPPQDTGDGWSIQIFAPAETPATATRPQAKRKSQ